MTSGEALDSVAESESTPAKKRHKNVLRRRPRFRASIQSKLMVLLLLTSIVSVAAIAAIVYQSGRTSLRAAAYERLTQLRESQKRAVETLFSDLTNSLVIYERGLTVVDASCGSRPALTSWLTPRSAPPNNRRSSTTEPPR